MREWANRHSATCFLNSLLREWPNYQEVDFRNGKALQIELPSQNGSPRRLIAPIQQFSILGRHQYTGEFFLSSEEQVQALSFEQMVEMVSESLQERFQSQPRQVNKFKSRVFSSRDCIQETLEHRSASFPASAPTTDGFIQNEQRLIVGHNFHPTPKSRDEFNADDRQRFSPELQGQFELEWFLVQDELVQMRTADSFEDIDWLRRLLRQELPEQDVPMGWTPLPMHPWQAEVLRRHPILQGYLTQGKMKSIGFGARPWQPTSSLRTLYRMNAPYMLKFSMSVKLTNSVRHLLIREVERGLQLRDVLHTKQGREFTARHPRFEILTEPAYVCLKDPQGRPMSETVVVCRENLFDDQAAPNKAVLATINQDAPLGGPSKMRSLLEQMPASLPLVERARTWFDRYLDLVVEPLISAQANFGFMLGAHQQNLVLDIQNGLATRAYFRDCQGTGYSELGYSLYAPQVKSIQRDNGNVLDAKMGNALFSYYLILNSTFNVITSLTQAAGGSENTLLWMLRRKLEQIRAGGVADPSCLNSLLENECLMHKGNFLCTFQNLNENTTEDPLALYNRVPNPLLDVALDLQWTETAGRRHPVRPTVTEGVLYRRKVPHLDLSIALRTVDVDQDLATFHEWHNQPRVFDLWELNKSIPELREYLVQGKKDAHQFPLFLELNGEAAGYFEIYWAAEDRISPHCDAQPFDRGFHFLIGNPKFLGMERTSAVLNAVSDFIFQLDPRTDRIVAEPRADNIRVIRYASLLPGWSFVREFDFPHKRAALLVCDRNRFYANGTPT